MRLLWLGTYERDYTRTRVLLHGLRGLGVEVVECHRPLWELTRHKAGTFLSPAGLPALSQGGSLLGVGVACAWSSAACPGVDAVVAGYPYQPDALPGLGVRARPARAARGRRADLDVGHARGRSRARGRGRWAARSPRSTP